MTKRKLNKIIEFGKKVLKDKNLEYIILICFDGYSGSHGFYYKKRGLITIGMDSHKRLVLHEIAHALDINEKGHYSDEFEFIYQELCEKYDTEVDLK